MIFLNKITFKLKKKRTSRKVDALKDTIKFRCAKAIALNGLKIASTITLVVTIGIRGSNGTMVCESYRSLSFSWVFF
jgi:hypothetical protein